MSKNNSVDLCPWSRQYEKFTAEPEVVFMMATKAIKIGRGNTVYLICLVASLGSTVAYKVEHLQDRPATCLSLSTHITDLT